MIEKSWSYLSVRWFPAVVCLTLLCNAGILLMPSCNSDGNREINQTKQVTSSEDLIRTNKTIVKDQSAEIDNYIRMRNYHMSTTATGLRYMIYKKGDQKIAVHNNDFVQLYYKVSLLDGTEVYNSDSTGALEFQIGKSEIAVGLQEGVRLMHKGDKAVFILPAHLAYGLTGDGNQIKYYEALVIDAELLDVAYPDVHKTPNP